MPTETAATRWTIGLSASVPSARSFATASSSATIPPVIEAQRVPPSACRTSQSMVICLSPSFDMSTAARRERPMRRCISVERASIFSFLMSRSLRPPPVEEGSMEYSAVTHPRPVSLRKGGTFSSTLAVHSTQVSPHFMSTLPAACFVKFLTNSIFLSWSFFRFMSLARSFPVALPLLAYFARIVSTSFPACQS